ncbi:MAG: hypothetical protein HYV26_13995 [Candidatus Hydrogenedentes bacterium]|nr:hypothetical protein [Candidatus Hydrogenedentota bacterium]
MTDAELFQIRLALVESYLRENDYDGVLLTRADNFAMATGGKRNYIWRHTDAGANSLFVWRTGRTWFVGNNVEEPRVMSEELQDLGCEALSFLWFEHSAAEVVAKEFSGTLVSDDGTLGKNVHEEMAVLRSLLAPAELDKYRALGKLAAESMRRTAPLPCPSRAGGGRRTHRVAPPPPADGGASAGRRAGRTVRRAVRHGGGLFCAGGSGGLAHAFPAGGRS